METKCPYKDARPEDTVNSIRNSLTKHNFFVHEAQWYQGPAGIFSCRLETEDHNAYSVGKGLGKSYTMASAYGELMERLQSYIFYSRLNMPRLVQDMQGFAFDPAEQRAASTAELPDLPESFKKAAPFTSGENLYDCWQQTKAGLVNERNINRFSSIPFYGVEEQVVVNLPFYFLNNFYISNGMSAGNSHEESITQGIGEIFERYAKIAIYFRGYDAPLIPDEQVRELSPEYYSLIRQLESQGKYRILIRDCSLGMGLPVACAIFIDRERNSYSIKFASDPDIAIAIQRCLTEYFQGLQSDDQSKMNPIMLDKDLETADPVNFYRATVVGNGQFPRRLLIDNRVSERVPVKSFSSNREKMEYSINLIRECGFPHIYIRDNSFLGFPAHQIIIPGMSEIKIFNNFDSIKSHISLNHYDILQLLNSEDEIEKSDEIRGFLEHESSWKLDDESTELYKLSYNLEVKNSRWLNMTVELLLSFIYYKRGSYERALNYLSRHIASVEKGKSSPKLQFHYCAKHYLTLKAEKLSDQEIGGALVNIYGEDLLMTTFNFFNSLNIKEMVKELELPLYNEEHSRQYIKLKTVHKENPINQEGLASLFK